MSEVNVLAFSEFATAGAKYLESNGWERVAPGTWKVPKHFGISAWGKTYLQWRAIQTQYQYDSDQLR